MRLEWAWVIPVMSVLLNSQPSPSPALPEAKAKKPATVPNAPQAPVVTQAGPTDCLSYRMEETGAGEYTVTCVLGGGGTGMPAPGGGGGSTPSPGGGGGGGGGSSAPGVPLSGELLARANQARTIALDKLANPQCATLFSGYPAPWNNGAYILGSYAALRGGSGTPACSSGAVAAWTLQAARPTDPVIHSNFIVLCGGFLNISSPNERANRLVHEALHIAGLRESPPDTSAMTTTQIDAMVRGACGS